MTAAASEEVSPWRQATPAQRQRRRRLLLGMLVAFLVVTALTGFPTGREVLTGWLLLVLLAACAGDVRLWRRVVVRDWLPLLAVLWLYDLLRGVANETGGALFGLPRWHSSLTEPAMTARAHLHEPLDFDKAAFGGHVPTVWLQQHLYTPGTAHWYDVLAVVVYLSHFLVSLGLAVVLWCVSYRLFRSYVVVLVSLTLAALATYVLYPAAPPWMAALNHQLPAVHRLVDEVLHAVGSGTLSSAVEQGAAYSNPVAAMPSLHAAVPMMLLLFFWSTVRAPGKVALVLYAAAMAVTLVYTGEHYATDVVAGWCYAAAVVGVRAGVTRWRSRRAPGRRPPTSSEQPPIRPGSAAAPRG